MFTDQIIERMSDLMFVQAGIPQRTVPLAKSFAVWAGGIETESILALQKIGKGEVVPQCRSYEIGVLGSRVRVRRCARAVTD